MLKVFYFNILHISRKQNVVTNAFSRRPRVNAVSIAYNHNMVSMIDKYVVNNNFVEIVPNLHRGQPYKAFSLSKGFLLHDSRLCVTKHLCENIMCESHEPLNS